MERSSKSCVDGEWVERVLERLCTLFSASISGECNGFGCIRGRHACITGVA